MISLKLKNGLTSLLSHFLEDERKYFMQAFEIHNWHTRYCVASLSKTYKILSQWRAYADDGKGLVIGFSPQFLRNVGVKYKVCKYSDHDKAAEDQAGKHERFINSVVEK